MQGGELGQVIIWPIKVPVIRSQGEAEEGEVFANER